MIGKAISSPHQKVFEYFLITFLLTRCKCSLAFITPLWSLWSRYWRGHSYPPYVKISLWWLIIKRITETITDYFFLPISKWKFILNVGLFFFPQKNTFFFGVKYTCRIPLWLSQKAAGKKKVKERWDWKTKKKNQGASHCSSGSHWSCFILFCEN